MMSRNSRMNDPGLGVLLARDSRDEVRPLIQEAIEFHLVEGMREQGFPYRYFPALPGRSKSITPPNQAESDSALLGCSFFEYVRLSAATRTTSGFVGPTHIFPMCSVWSSPTVARTRFRRPQVQTPSVSNAGHRLNHKADRLTCIRQYMINDQSSPDEGFQ
jgi:hypothetical protein